MAPGPQAELSSLGRQATENHLFTQDSSTNQLHIFGVIYIQIFHLILKVPDFLLRGWEEAGLYLSQGQADRAFLLLLFFLPSNQLAWWHQK